MGNLDSFPAPDAGREQAGADHIRPLLQRLRLNWLLQRFPPRLVRALYVFVNSFLTIGALALLALVSRNPFVFPSLGPTAYLLFFTPLFKGLQPAKHDFRSRHRAHLRLWGFRCHGRRSPAVRNAPRYLLAANPGGGSLTGGHGRLHGSVRSQPSTSRSHNTDRFSRDHLAAARTRHHRGSGAAACSPGNRDQSTCRIVLPLVECPHGRRDTRDRVALTDIRR